MVKILLMSIRMIMEHKIVKSSESGVNGLRTLN